jgi:nitroimidazol reductase NimA-like FMN-containing flavoprotein (pyridoxamine 5'-phosphate oxidase superfamily)
MEELEPAAPSERTRVRRLPRRAATTARPSTRILDEALICHLAFAAGISPSPSRPPTPDRRPTSTCTARPPAARCAPAPPRGLPDRPRSSTASCWRALAFHHSMNYRSVVVLGRAEEVCGDRSGWPPCARWSTRCRRALVGDPTRRTGRSSRPPPSCALSLAEASAKIRTGPPIDDEEDLALPCWAGVVRSALTRGPAIPDPASAVDHLSGGAGPGRRSSRPPGGRRARGSGTPAASCSPRASRAPRPTPR